MTLSCWTPRSCTLCLVAAVWLLQQQQPVAQASVISSLRQKATTTRTSSRSRGRGLQATTYLTYTTTSDVQEEALLDLDVLALGAQLAIDTVEGLDSALNVYEDGRLSDTSLNAPTYTLQSLSTTHLDTTATMIEVLQLYQDYYGVADYANQWILGAFKDADSTASAFKNGKMDYELLSTIEAQAVAIKTAVVVMSVWMKVVQEVYEAIDRCNYLDMEASLEHWDQAVAFYTGSSITEPASQGAMLYSLAQTHCKTFGTCNPVSGMAQVNTAIYEDFNVGKEMLQARRCLEAKANADNIFRWMKVPLIQGTLSSIYSMDLVNDDRVTTRAQGAAYAAAILPLLDECNSNYATLVYRDMDLAMSSLGSFEVVKDALESQYDCLSITCDDVGGIVDLANSDQYVQGAGPCGLSGTEDEDDEGGNEGEGGDEENTPKTANNNTSSNNNIDAGLAIGLLVAVAVVLASIALMTLCLCRRRRAGASDGTTFAEPKPNPGIT
jgi:hypothetical protein